MKKLFFLGFLAICFSSVFSSSDTFAARTPFMQAPSTVDIMTLIYYTDTQHPTWRDNNRSYVVAINDIGDITLISVLNNNLETPVSWNGFQLNHTINVATLWANTASENEHIRLAINNTSVASSWIQVSYSAYNSTMVDNSNGSSTDSVGSYIPEGGVGSSTSGWSLFASQNIDSTYSLVGDPSVPYVPVDPTINLTYSTNFTLNGYNQDFHAKYKNKITDPVSDLPDPQTMTWGVINLDAPDPNSSSGYQYACPLVTLPISDTFDSTDCSNLDFDTSKHYAIIGGAFIGYATQELSYNNINYEITYKSTVQAFDIINGSYERDTSTSVCSQGVGEYGIGSFCAQTNKYKDCDILDVGCNLSNFFTRLQDLIWQAFTPSNSFSYYYDNVFDFGVINPSLTAFRNLFYTFLVITPECNLNIPETNLTPTRSFPTNTIIPQVCQRTNQLYQTFPIIPVFINFLMALVLLKLIAMFINSLINKDDTDVVVGV